MRACRGLPIIPQQTRTGQERKIRILELFYEPGFSGISRHVTYILRGMDRNKYEIWVLCSTGDERIRAKLEALAENGRVTIVPPRRVFSLSGTLQALKLIRRNKIDTIHIHNMQSALWAYGAAILTNTSRVIFTPQVVNLPWPMIQRIFYHFWRLLKGFTLMNIAVTETQHQIMIHQGIAEAPKIRTIPNCVDEAEILGKIHRNKDVVRSELSLNGHDVVVCQVGRLIRQKDPEALLKIAVQIQERVSGVTFLLIGEGPLRGRLEGQIQRLGLNGMVRLLGFRSDALEILNGSDIAVLTSRWEGMPYFLVEAICLKKPIVATDIPGNRDLVVDGITGFLARTEMEFSDRIMELAASKCMREQMGYSGYHRNKDLFALEQMVRQVEQIYDLQPMDVESLRGGRTKSPRRIP